MEFGLLYDFILCLLPFISIGITEEESESHLHVEYINNLSKLVILISLIYMQKGNNDYYTYGGWWSVWWTGTYSMVLSKAAFFHKKYFSVYTNEMPASIRDFVTKNRSLLTFFSPCFVDSISIL